MMEMVLGKWAPPSNIAAKIGSPAVVKWSEGELVNGHILIAGGSGFGKTFNIRKIINRLSESSTRPPRVHVFDVHGDISFPDASEVIFSEISQEGLNPLIVDPDPHTGGVRKAIKFFIATLNKVRKLGERQEAVLTAVLEDLYKANGFYPDRPETWSLNDGIERSRPKKHPNVDDLLRWTNFKYRQMFTGGNSKAAFALDNLNKKASKMQREMKRMGKSLSSDEEQALDKMKGEAVDAYTDYINAIKTGEEIDELLKYDSKTTLKSVLDRISNLNNSGIFKKNPPSFDPHSNIWRYQLSPLSKEEKRMFVFFKMRELYSQAMSRGLSDEIVEVIVLDESKMFMDADPDNIISVMANEIRKFGVALICASQAFTHFTDDFLSSVGTKIVLGIDEMYWDKTARQLNMKREWLEWITPRKTALIQMKRTVSGNDPTSKVKWYPTHLC